MTEASEVLDLDLSGIETPTELHVVLWDRLQFPSYYGRNWDAFWDCITDSEQSSMPKVLRLSGWSALSRKMPRDASLLRELLDALPAERPEILVEWA